MVSAKQPRTKPIEQVQLGERVLGENPELGDEDRGFVEPEQATWRKLRLRAPKRDGSWADVELIRSLSWLDEQKAKVGGTVEITVPECGIEGQAEVLAIGPCPPIQSGAGHVVTGTFRHGSVQTVEVKVEGLEKPIDCTPNHPFWSEDHHEFVRADALRPGEHLRTLKGLAQVVSVVPHAGPDAVYNLEVQGEHVYQVTSSGVLVHNGWTCTQTGDIGEQVLRDLIEERPNWKVLDSMQNGSGHGIDLIAEYVTSNGTRRLVVFEVKTNSARLSYLQKMGLTDYLKYQLEKAANWTTADARTMALRQSLEDRLLSGETVKGVAVYVDLATGLIRGIPWRGSHARKSHTLEHQERASQIEEVVGGLPCRLRLPPLRREA